MGHQIASIKNLVQATLDHYKTLCPQDPQQAILEQLEKLKAENAALKAGQVLDSTDPANPPPTSGQSRQVAAQPKQPDQAHLRNYFASPSASPPPMHQPTPWRPIDASLLCSTPTPIRYRCQGSRLGQTIRAKGSTRSIVQKY